MGMFGNLFGHGSNKDTPELLSAIERAVSGVEPLLTQISGYPDNYRKPVIAALEYAHSLAASVPGPVVLDRESYASDALVHVLFPDINIITETICSSLSMQKYQHDFPDSDEIYALMGMRCFEKSTVGMELSGQTIQRDVAQKAVYFTSHTLENPAPSEHQARNLAANNFFDCLVCKVKERVEERKHVKQSQQMEKDMLLTRLHTANAQERPLIEGELSRLLSRMQSTISSLELGNYIENFEAVLLNPEQYLRLDQKPLILDSPVILDGLGIRRDGDDASRGEKFMFNELIGYDRRDWTVTMVQCNNLQSESFAARLEKAYRKLVINQPVVL